MARWLALLVGLMALTQPATARTLEEIRALGRLTLCVYPNQLPFSSDRADRPGIYIDFGRAIAAELQVDLRVSWLGPRSRRRPSECDLGFDEIQGQEVKGYGIRVTRPYLRTGIALLVRAGLGVRGYADLRAHHRIGASLGSEGEAYLKARGLTPRPFALTEEMERAFAAGEVDVILLPAQATAYALHTQPRENVELLHAWREEPALAWNLIVVLREPDDAYLQAVDSAIGTLMGDGRLAALYGRYGIPYVTPASP